jgi:signal-transduction protein with cAMP-binding, CBS, and nucleotidyltransferase domain
MERLRKYFENCGFNENDLSLILGAFRLEEFRKEEFFLKRGKLNHYLGFVEKGVFLHYIQKDDELRATYVSIENTFISSRLGFENDTLAIENIQALTNCIVSVISKEDLRALTAQIPKFKDFYIGFLERSINMLDSNRQDMIVLSGEERYAKLLKKEPNLLQAVPLRYLASMLGITPRHLSRIRKNIR